MKIQLCNRLLLFLFIAMLPVLNGCETIVPSAPANPSLTAQDIISRVSASMPAVCDYNGRAVVRYTVGAGEVAATAIINKSCEGSGVVKLLGGFGMSVADISFDGDSYQVMRNGEDVTAEFNATLSPKVVADLMKYAVTPPVILDDTYTLYQVSQSSYHFSDGLIFVEVNGDFNIATVTTPDYVIEYKYIDGTLSSIQLYFDINSLYVKFNSWGIAG